MMPHTLCYIPDVFAVDSDRFIVVWGFSHPDLLDFSFAAFVIRFVLIALSSDFIFLSAPNHVVDFLVQHPIHFLGEVLCAHSCPCLQVLFVFIGPRFDIQFGSPLT